MPDDASANHGLALALTKVAGLMMFSGNAIGARPLLHEGVATLRELVGREPNNSRWAGDLSRMLARLG